MTNIDKKVKELFEAGCHLGHKTNKIHPKAKNIFTPSITVLPLST